MTDDPRPAGPERAPHGDFRLARGRAREHQQRHVGRDEHQEHHDEDVPEGQPQLEATRVEEQPGIRNELSSQVLVRPRPTNGRAVTDRLQLGLRLRFGRVPIEPSEHQEAGCLAGRGADGVNAERYPDLVRGWKHETLGHHARHGPSLAAQSNRPSDDPWIAGESPLPDVMANDDHRRRAGIFVSLDKRPAQQRQNTGHPEGGRAHRRHLHSLGLAIVRDEVAGKHADGAQVLDRRERVTPGREVVRGRQDGAIQ